MSERTRVALRYGMRRPTQSRRHERGRQSASAQRARSERTPRGLRIASPRSYKARERRLSTITSSRARLHSLARFHVRLDLVKSRLRESTQSPVATLANEINEAPDLRQETRRRPRLLRRATTAYSPCAKVDCSSVVRFDSTKQFTCTGLTFLEMKGAVKRQQKEQKARSRERTTREINRSSTHCIFFARPFAEPNIRWQRTQLVRGMSSAPVRA